MAYETLSFHVSDGVARLALNRPNAANAFNTRICRDLFDAAIACDERDDIRAVVLTGEGSMFSAGGDLKFFAAQSDTLGVTLKEITGLLHAAIGRMAHMDAPVVGAIKMILSADVRRCSAITIHWTAVFPKPVGITIRLEPVSARSRDRSW